jgi:hypothetical protein
MHNIKKLKETAAKTRPFDHFIQMKHQSDSNPFSTRTFGSLIIYDIRSERTKKLIIKTNSDEE